MRLILQTVFGKTPRERIANVISYGLFTALVMVSLQLKWALKSPNPTEWNVYSPTANDFLYTSLNPTCPMPARVVSHRAGNIPGIREAAPLDRLEHNYTLGQRLFEMDFAWTSDDQLVVKHDWNERSAIPTCEAFLAEIPGKNASLSMVYDWLAEHPDAFIVTDCKKRSLECIAKIRMERPDLVPQFIPQIYQFKDYDLVQSQGFRNVILTLYRCLSDESTSNIVEFSRRHPLFALTIPRQRAGDKELIASINQLKTPIYVHTINDTGEVARLQSAGVHGIYSDDLNCQRIAARPSSSSTRR